MHPILRARVLHTFRTLSGRKSLSKVGATDEFNYEGVCQRETEPSMKEPEKVFEIRGFYADQCAKI